MTATVSLTDAAVFTALRSFLIGILPAGIEVIKAQDNRVPEPEGPDFVTMTPLRRPRLATNIDTSADAKFTGSIAAALMTITAVQSGVMNIGATVFGVGVAANTIVSAQLTGSPPGGIGTYIVAPSQTLAATTLSAGQTEIKQSTEVVIQLDVHGLNSADNTQVISTLFRDAYGVAQFAGSGVTPLYADDPRQVPFINAEQQYEQRWIVDVHLQIDPVVAVSAQFADKATITLVDVPETFPA
jgi:hypothetical protein